MQAGLVRRDLISQAGFDLPVTEDTKMAPGAQHKEGDRGEDMEEGTNRGPQTTTPGPNNVSTILPQLLSPASPPSLLKRTLHELITTPLRDHTDNCYTDMLSRGLAQTAPQITSTIQADL